jgi:hypothetical protein
MLIIRAEQMKVFGQAAFRSFEDEMVLHLARFAPKHSQVIGEPVVRQVIRRGAERARTYHLTNHGPVRFYIEMMFQLGSEFDTDPQLPWAREILAQAATSDQMECAERLYEVELRYLNAVMGPDDEYEKEAIRRMINLRLVDIPSDGATLEGETFSCLRRIYPQKFDHVGEPAIRSLIRRSSALADEYSIATTEGVALLAGLMFAFGHGATTDPQFPWIRSTLMQSTETESPARQVELLFGRMTMYLTHALRNMD